jgi:NAD(P)-dependent dehydrogenase (short-subunit alcohol dehydrogenase family)
VTARQRVAVVTGGGGGIGAAVAEELGRQGWHVVTVDPLVTLDGAERLPEPEETTAGRIVAAGGSARASAVSVTDGDGVRALFEELASERGGLDAVVNVAGITRPTGYASGTEDDWRSVIAVHLDGYRNVLAAALPLMAAAGHGRILGVTSGSGWRAADAGAYSCAKRAVASLTWQLGRDAPAGVTVNAMSPIAATRMVAAALARVAAANPGGAAGGATGGLALGSMPEPEALGPVAAHLVGDGIGWCSGRIVFVGGSEVAVVDEPRLLEVVRTGDGADPALVLATAGPEAFAVAEAQQATAGGSNARFGSIFEGGAAADAGSSPVRSCAVVSDRPEVGTAIGAALAARGVASRVLDAAAGFDAAARALEADTERSGPADGVVLAPSGGPASAAATGWERVLAEHAGVADGIHTDAAWTRAVADRAAGSGGGVRLVTVTDATTAGGRSRAQAAAQLSRVGRKATGGAVVPFALSMETGAAEDLPAVGAFVAHLLCSDGADALSGAELVAAEGWAGVRSHPRAGGSMAYGGPAVPSWFDDALRQILEAR